MILCSLYKKYHSTRCLLALVCSSSSQIWSGADHLRFLAAKLSSGDIGWCEECVCWCCCCAVARWRLIGCVWLEICETETNDKCYKSKDENNSCCGLYKQIFRKDRERKLGCLRPSWIKLMLINGNISSNDNGNFRFFW